MTAERKIKGRIAEASVLKHFVSEGHDVFTGYTDNNKHDLIVFDGENLLRVFVRYTSASTNVSWKVSLTNVYRSKTGPVVKFFEPEHFDLIAVYVAPEDRVVVLDAKIENTSGLYIPKMNPEPKPRPTKIVWPSNEELMIMLESNTYKSVALDLGVSVSGLRSRLRVKNSN
ncbi:Holliday junction resolvase [Arthrobacter phage Racecar]|nr:holliday junction resolvase [Arthrobacter phage Racecar]